MSRVTWHAALVHAEEYDALDTLAAKLEGLKALDVSALPQSGDRDSVLPTAAGADDPVLPPPIAGTTVTAHYDQCGRGSWWRGRVRGGR